MELPSPKLIAKATGNRPKSTERIWIIWTNPCIFRCDLLVSGRVLTMDTLGWFPGWYEFKIRGSSNNLLNGRSVSMFFCWSFMCAKKPHDICHWFTEAISKGGSFKNTMIPHTFQLRCAFASISYKVIQPPDSMQTVLIFHIDNLRSEASTKQKTLAWLELSNHP